jgi:hypothetical protein
MTSVYHPETCCTLSEHNYEITSNPSATHLPKEIVYKGALIDMIERATPVHDDLDHVSSPSSSAIPYKPTQSEKPVATA